MEGQVNYKLVARFESKNAITEVYRPDLEPEEYKRRFKMLYGATEAVLKEKYWPETDTRE